MPIIKTNSVQLLTAFSAAHWFHLQEFFKESDRILVDNGVVALIGFELPGPLPIDPSNPNDNRLIELMNESLLQIIQTLGPTKQLSLIAENNYKDLKFPQNYEYVYKDNIIGSQTACALDLVGNFKSWFIYQGLVANDKKLSEEVLNEFIEKLKNIVKTDDLSTKEITINYKYFIAMGRKLK